MPRADGVLAGAPADSLATPLSPSTGAYGTDAPSVLSLEPASPQIERDNGAGVKTWGTTLREYSSFVLIGAAYSVYMYMTWSKHNNEDDDWGDYPLCWVSIGVLCVCLIVNVVWKYKLDECRLGSKDGSRKFKFSRISGWFWCIVIMLILLSIPTVLYFFGDIQLCDTKDEELCSKNDGCKYQGGKCQPGKDAPKSKANPQAYGKILSSVFTVLAMFLGVR